MGHAGNAVASPITDSEWFATGCTLAMTKLELGKGQSFLSLFTLHHSLFTLPLLLLETDTEAEIVGAVAGGVEVVAVGRTQVRAAIVPGAAPKDTGGARSRTFRVGL